MHRKLMTAAVVLIAMTGIARAEGCIVADPTGTPLNVRKDPSSSAAILGALNNGTSVSTGATRGEWVRIVPQEGKTGWVYRKYLDCPQSSAVLPKAIQGTWCGSTTDEHTRCGRGGLDIKSNGWGLEDTDCTVRSSEELRGTSGSSVVAALVTARCHDYGAGKWSGVAQFLILLRDGKLSLMEVKR
jgi:Bacterial SH3 domain